MSAAGVAPGSAEIEHAGERALLVRFRDADLGLAVGRARTLGRRLRDAGADPGTALPEHELVSGAGSLLLRFDRTAGRETIDAAAERLRKLVDEPSAADTDSAPGREQVLDVDFGGEAGPDLDAVANAVGLDATEVVGRLCAARLTVAFVGFSPGFPYLIGLPSELVLPRRASPRPRVPKGSVAIAGPFAGVYPSATPGGWHLLGRTDATLFDPSAEPPARLAAGDRVRFARR